MATPTKGNDKEKLETGMSHLPPIKNGSQQLVPPFSSPSKHRKYHRPRTTVPGSMESLPSDMSIEIPDITLEVDKITKEKVDPEIGMRETNRLIKEIDQQMEMSFEIMEDRTHMVRQFLKERERADQNHRRRAEQMMSQFNNKISTMENVLGVTITNSKSNKTSTTQTEMIKTANTEIQTSFEKLIQDKQDIQEVVRTFTQDMKDVVEKQLMKEKQILLRELDEQRKAEYQDQINQIIEQINKQALRNKAEQLLEEIITTISEPELKEEISKNKFELIDYLDDKDSGENIELSLPDDLRKELKKKKEILKAESIKQNDCDLTELKSACKQIDLLEASLDSVLKEIQEHLQLNENEINTLSNQVKKTIQSGSIDNAKRVELFNRLKKNYRRSTLLTPEVEKETYVAFDKLISKQIEISKTENRISRLAIQSCSIPIQTMLNESIETLKNCTNYSNKGNAYKHSEIENELEHSQIDILTVEPKLGNILYQDLVRFDGKSQTEAIKILYYQDKPLQEILDDYEEEIKEMQDCFDVGKVYEEIDSIVSRSTNGNILPCLTSELAQVEQTLDTNKPLIRNIREKLDALKIEKDDLIETEQELNKKKTDLAIQLKTLNRQVTDHLLNAEKMQVVYELENCIKEITRKIDKIQIEIKDIELEITGDEYTEGTTQEKETINHEKPELLSQKISNLRNDLQKLSPYLNKNSTKYCANDLPVEPPSSEDVCQIVATRQDLSRKLIETENKIQDIITTIGYESSENEYSGVSQNTPNEVNRTANSDIHDKTFSEKLLQIDMELEGINNELALKDTSKTSLAELKQSSETLKKALVHVEEKLKIQSCHPEIKKHSRELERLTDKINKLKTSLTQNGVQNFNCDVQATENLIKTKLKYETKLENIIERVTEDDEKRKTIYNSLKYLFTVRDQTKRKLFILKSDMEKMKRLSTVMNEQDDIVDKLIQLETQAMEKKTEGLSATIILAHERLQEFLHGIKNCMYEKLENSTKVSNNEKQSLSLEEKKILTRELETILDDIQQSKTELSTIEDFKTSGIFSKSCNTLMKSLSEKKQELLSNLETVHSIIESEEVALDERKLKKTLDKKIELKQELSELEERMEDQESILKTRLQKLQEIKEALENKLVASISIDDFKMVISLFEENREDAQHTSNTEINTLFCKRQDLTRKYQESGHKEKVHIEQLKQVDNEITSRINKIFMNQEEVVDANSCIFYKLLTDTAPIVDMINTSKDLQKIVSQSLGKDKKLGKCNTKEYIKEVYIELQEIEDLRSDALYIKEKKLNLKDIKTLEQLKSLNETKMDLLMTHIRKMNFFIEKDRTVTHFDKKDGCYREKMIKDGNKISRELDEFLDSYTSEVHDNELIVLSKPYIKELPIKRTSLDYFLQERDEKLRRIFIIDKQLESKTLSAKEICELQKEKTDLENLVEEIDEKIIDGDFEDEAELDTSARSFSPRSTSSRNSMAYILDERDKLMKKIFQLEKQEEFLKQSEDILNKNSTILDIQEEKNKIIEKLKDLEEKNRLPPDLSADTIIGEIENEYRDEAVIYALEEDLITSLNSLQKEVKTGKLEAPTDSGIVTDVKYLLSDPMENEVLDIVQDCDNKLREEKLKRRLKTLEERKAAIENNSDYKNLVQAIKEKQKILSEINSKIELICKKESLEVEREVIQKKILENDMKNDKAIKLEHKDVTRNKPNLIKNDLKKSKVEIEKQLDEINIVIGRYSNALEKQIIEIEEDVANVHEKKQTLTESLESLQNHKKELQHQLQGIKKPEYRNHLEDELLTLLTKRRETKIEIHEIEKQYNLKIIDNKKKELTVELRKYHAEEKKFNNIELRMTQKGKILKKKIDSTKVVDDIKTENSQNLKLKLGESLYELLINKERSPKEKYLRTLLSCLEDRNVSEYIQELSTLCAVQTEQIENLKRDTANAHDTQHKAFTQQITMLENELIALHAHVSEEESRQKTMKMKLGTELYNMINQEKASPSQTSENEDFLKAITSLLKQEKGTIENLLRQNYTDSQKLNEHILLVTELTQEKMQFQNEIHEKDDEIELLKKKASDFCSETESLRDHIRECEFKTNCITGEGEQLKNDYEHTKEELVWVIDQYEKLKKDFNELAKVKTLSEELKETVDNLLQENNALKEQLVLHQKSLPRAVVEEKIAAEEANITTSLSEIAFIDDGQPIADNGMESLRRKIRRITKDKSNLQESLGNEVQKVNKLEEEVSALKHKEKLSTREMHKHCQVIERQEKEIKVLKELTASLENQNSILQSTVNDLKEKYQAQSIKHHNESSKAMRELKSAKIKVEEQKNKIEKLHGDDDNVMMNNSHEMRKVLESENNNYKKKITRLEEELEQLHSKQEEDEAKSTKIYNECQKMIDKLKSDNIALQTKLNDLDESFANELSQTKKELNGKYNESAQKLKEKITKLANDLIDAQNMNEKADEEKRKLETETRRLSKELKERDAMSETKDKTYQVKESTLSAEIEGLVLENDELRDEILDLKRQIRKIKDIEQKEFEINEAQSQLQIKSKQLQLEQSEFEETMQEFMKKPLRCSKTNTSQDERVSVQILKATQEEKEKISIELVRINKELLQTRNEVRKLKTLIREKEEEFCCAEERLLATHEKEQKSKTAEIQRLCKLEKERMLKVYTEEQNKWEEEMEILKQNLQEENLKKLQEQQIDFDKELEQQLEFRIKANQEELEELRDQVDILKKQRLELINQFENDKSNLVKKYESERDALEETIRRLLGSLLKVKERKNRLRLSHEDEISELEERFESEKDRLAEKREEEIAALKTKLQKSSSSNIHSVKKIIQETFEAIIADSSTNKLHSLRNKLDELVKQLPSVKGMSTSKFTLNDLKELVQMGDLDDILDSEYEAEQDIIKQGVREQYKAKLREETDNLMKRLLVLSDELESLRSYH